VKLCVCLRSNYGTFSLCITRGFCEPGFLFSVSPSSMFESAFIPFVSFGDLDNNTFKGLTHLLSVEQEIQYDEYI
jgi:hypothetical protein